MDQSWCRFLLGETIPQQGKVFSNFETHTRRISKGKAGCPVEFGVQACILEDEHGFVLQHEVMWQGSNAGHAVPMPATAQERFPDLRAVCFDRGVHSPDNRMRTDGMLDLNVQPKKVYLTRADREPEAGDEFFAMRRAHPAVELAVGSPGHQGLGRVLSRGAGGFARSVALVAVNIHRIWIMLRRVDGLV